MLIDTHAHLNFNAFKDDFSKVIDLCLENNIWVVNIGSKYENSKKAIEMAESYDQGVYAVIGLHPVNLDTGLVKMKHDSVESNSQSKEADFDYDRYKKLTSSGKAIAIGETGLDYYWRPKTTRKKELFKGKQRDLFLKHLKLAKELGLPVVLHCRMAHQDLIEILQDSEVRPQRAVAHSFVGDLGQLQKYLEFGYYIGYNGIIFKKIEGINFEELIKETPLDRLLIETDSPYLSPLAEERNTPLNLEHIVKRIAEIKGKSFEEISEITTKNARELFKI